MRPGRPRSTDDTRHGAIHAAKASSSTFRPLTTTTTASPAGCKAVQAPKPKPDGGQKAPKAALEPAKTYTVTLIVKDSGLTGSPECALSSSPQTVTVTVPAGTAPPAQ